MLVNSWLFKPRHEGDRTHDGPRNTMNTSMTLCDGFTVLGKAISIHPDDDLCITPDLLLLLALNG